jgi:hypothetical protein
MWKETYFLLVIYFVDTLEIAKVTPDGSIHVIARDLIGKLSSKHDLTIIGTSWLAIKLASRNPLG